MATGRGAPPPGEGTLEPTTGRITFSVARPDLLKLGGALVPAPIEDPTTAPATVELENANGLLFLASLPAGALAKRGTGYVARDREATRSGGIGSLRIVQRANRPLSIALRAYGDLSAATLPEMTVRLTIGGRSYTMSATWSPRGNGWSSPRS